VIEDKCAVRIEYTLNPRRSTKIQCISDFHKLRIRINQFWSWCSPGSWHYCIWWWFQRCARFI